jgi:hypothetical protein
MKYRSKSQPKIGQISNSLGNPTENPKKSGFFQKNRQKGWL